MFSFTVPELQDYISEVRGPVLLHMCGRERQQSVLPGGDSQFCRGAQRIFSQRVRTGPGLQLLQGVQRSRRDVLGRRDPRNVPDQSIKATSDPKRFGIVATVGLSLSLESVFNARHYFVCPQLINKAPSHRRSLHSRSDKRADSTILILF